MDYTSDGPAIPVKPSSPSRKPNPGETYRSFVARIPDIEGWEWTRPWWHSRVVACVDNGTPKGNSFEVKNLDEPVPENIRNLGCLGFDDDGVYWVGWDLDVGHGKNPCSSDVEAILEAQKLKAALGDRVEGLPNAGGEADIRRSKSGDGVHVKVMLPFDATTKDGEPLAEDHVKAIVKGIALRLGLHDDKAAEGRQNFWMWTQDGDPVLNDRSYVEISSQDKPLLDLPDIMVDILSKYVPTEKKETRVFDPSGFDESSDVIAAAIKSWKHGSLSGSTPRGERMKDAMRHFVNDWGLSIPQSQDIVIAAGGNPDRDVRQWERM